MRHFADARGTIDGTHIGSRAHSALKPLLDIFLTPIWFGTSRISTSAMSGVHDTDIRTLLMLLPVFSPASVVPASEASLAASAGVCLTVRGGSAGGGGGGNRPQPEGAESTKGPRKR